METAASKVVFGQSFEGLLRALAPLEPELQQGLKALRIPPEGPYAVAYPLETYLELLELVARVRYPGQDDLTAFTEVGRQFLRGFGQTLLGKAMLAATRVLGPRRTLARMTRNFRTANNYSSFELTELGPAEFELRCNYVAKPGFYRGLLLEGLSMAGAGGVEVTFMGSLGHEATYRVRWTP